MVTVSTPENVVYVVFVRSNVVTPVPAGMVIVTNEVVPSALTRFADTGMAVRPIAAVVLNSKELFNSIVLSAVNEPQVPVDLVIDPRRTTNSSERALLHNDLKASVQISADGSATYTSLKYVLNLAPY